MKTAQVIALLLPDSPPEAPLCHPVQMGRSAMALMRDAAGRMTVEEVVADNDFMNKLVDTGCFRRGKPILDPATREVMGYEMEMIGPYAARAAAEMILAT
jgi:hypothetical protein